MTLVQETVNGRALIHAMKFHSFFSEQMYSHVNEWSRFNYFSATIMNAGTHFVNILAFFISVSAASVVLFNRDDFQNPAMVGVALGYSFLLPYFLGLFALMIQMLLTAATSLERILQYQSDEVPQAPAWHLKRDKELERKDWPSLLAHRRSSVCVERNQQKQDPAEAERRLASERKRNRRAVEEINSQAAATRSSASGFDSARVQS